MGTSPPDFDELSHACFSETTTAAASTPLQTIKMVEMKGTYERTSADKYDEFLTALGVNMLLRKAATASTPVMTVSEENGEWTIKTSTMLKSMELKAVVTQEGDKLITVQTAKKEGEKSTKSTREFFDDKCVVTIEITGTDVVCTQTFTRK